MVDVFEHSARLDTAAVEERCDLVQVVPDGGKLPCNCFDLVRVNIEHIKVLRVAIIVSALKFVRRSCSTVAYKAHLLPYVATYPLFRA